MNKQPLVSIIMNCYNSDTYLREAIESVFDQTYQNWEIIFWDNQSSDESANIINSYQDSRVKYFYAPEHTPLGEARNLAIDKAIGEWVAILDADDIWHKDKLQDSFEQLSSHDDKESISLIYSKTVYIDKNSKVFHHYEEHYDGDIHKLLLTKGDFIFISSAIFRADVLRTVGKIDEKLHYCEDYDILLKVTKSYKSLCINEFHTFYRVHDANLTNSKVYAYEVENFKFLNDYVDENSPSLGLRVILFLRNSQRMTAAIIKLAIKKDFAHIVDMIKEYWRYMLLSPYYLFHFGVKVFYKKFLSPLVGHSVST